MFLSVFQQSNCNERVMFDVSQLLKVTLEDSSHIKNNLCNYYSSSCCMSTCITFLILYSVLKKTIYVHIMQVIWVQNNITSHCPLFGQTAHSSKYLIFLFCSADKMKGMQVRNDLRVIYFLIFALPFPIDRKKRKQKKPTHFQT